MTRVLVTGAEGFIGRNLCVRLGERDGVELFSIGRSDGPEALAAAARKADFVFHFAGVNRPPEESEFLAGNVGSADRLCRTLAEAGSRAPIIYASSTQALIDNPYGRSKRMAEDLLLRHGASTGAPIHLFRLPNVFGKWAKPNYNSAVATFCNATARGCEVNVHDATAPLNLAYIDDVVDAFLRLMDEEPAEFGFREVAPVYATTVGEVAEIIRSFPGSRETMVTPPVGAGLVRALYSTYLSYLRPKDFAYEVRVHGDPRGVFVEMLKTRDSGQFSYFTAGPGVTRGNHYHHSKAEKFLVIAGEARFGFRNIVTDESHSLVTRGGDGQIVETIPGWTHNITNIGEDELIVMLWANEIFDPDRPDTIGMKI